MARYTPAYSSFVSRLNEVDDLRKTAIAREREDAVRHRNHINALCRGSIVLLSAHLEAYIRELGETALEAIVINRVDRSRIAPRFFYHISKGILEEISDTKNHDKIAAKVFDFVATDSDFWQRTGAFGASLPAVVFSKGFSNPTYDKICTYLNRFGYEIYRHELARKLQANYQPATNMVNHLVDMRNKIAHGDPAASKTPSEVGEMILIIKLFCGATDSVFGSWCKANLCTIR